MAATLVVLYLLSGTYSVQSDESAVARRFGRVVEGDVISGIHWNPPWPFGRTSMGPGTSRQRRIFPGELVSVCPRLKFSAAWRSGLVPRSRNC